MHDLSRMTSSRLSISTARFASIICNLQREGCLTRRALGDALRASDLARMSARGPRIGDGCTVWAKVQDIVADHSQLVGHFERRAPSGFVGKWIKGKCDRSVGRTANQQPSWLVHFDGMDSSITLKRSRLVTQHPGVHPGAILPGLRAGGSSPPSIASATSGDDTAAPTSFQGQPPATEPQPDA